MGDVGQIRSGAGVVVPQYGSPHYVEFVEELDAVDVCGRGRTIRIDTARFPQGTNVNFVRITGEDASPCAPTSGASRPRRSPAAREPRRQPSLRTSPSSPQRPVMKSPFPEACFGTLFAGTPYGTLHEHPPHGPGAARFSRGGSKPKISNQPPTIRFFHPMKTPKGVRDPHSDELRKAKRLEPMRKSGKDRHALYSTLPTRRTRSTPTPAGNRHSITSTMTTSSKSPSIA